MKEWLSIGDLSRMFNLNVQTLRYYESIGLFVPEKRDVENNYRQYRFDQIYKLASISYLKKLGYSLKDIREYMDGRDLNGTLEHLKHQSDLIMKQWYELSRMNDVIQRKIRYVHDRTEIEDRGAIVRKTFPVRRYIPIGSEDILYSSNDFYFYPTIVFYRGKKKEFGALITDDSPLPDTPALEVEEVEEGEYLCTYHEGPYSEISRTSRRIYREGESLGLTLDDFSVNLNLIDQFVASDPAKYLTEVQVRILV